MAKIREIRCDNCFTKVVQVGKGRTAKLCQGCRDKRAEDWRADQKPKEKKEDKPIDTVGGDNA
jgi:hypothetical protein